MGFCDIFGHTFLQLVLFRPEVESVGARNQSPQYLVQQSQSQPQLHQREEVLSPQDMMTIYANAEHGDFGDELQGSHDRRILHGAAGTDVKSHYNTN